MQIEVNANLYISPYQATDVDAMVELLSDEEIYRMTLRIPRPYTSADAEQFLAMIARQEAEHPETAICAIRQGSGALIGGIGLHRNEQWWSHRAEFGYWLGRRFWGQGIMTTVVRAMVRHAFEQPALTKLTAGVFAFNQASARVLEKCGFVEEGLLRGDLVKDGQLIDMRLFGLLR